MNFYILRYFSKNNIYCFFISKILFCNYFRLLFLMMKIENQELVKHVK